MTDVIGKLKKVTPILRTVYYEQDNAGCYRSGGTITGVIQTKKSHGVTVQRLDFSHPQGGKGACDQKERQSKPTFESIWMRVMMWWRGNGKPNGRGNAILGRGLPCLQANSASISLSLIVYPRPRHKLAWAVLDMGCNYIEYIENDCWGV